MLSNERIDNLFASIEEIKELIRAKAIEEANNRWIESEKAREMLGVSPKTWQIYRDSRVIPFSQFGRKIYVKQGDIEDYLRKNYVGKTEKESKDSAFYRSTSVAWLKILITELKLSGEDPRKLKDVLRRLPSPSEGIYNEMMEQLNYALDCFDGHGN